MSPLGYIVIEWNQASGRPSPLQFGDLYDTWEDAEQSAAAERIRTAKVGRRERHTVAEVTDTDEADR